MAVFRSGENLLSETLDFISIGSSVKIFSPFIRVNKLDEILQNKPCDFIVVRWLPGDIIQGVTDFEDLYMYCEDNNIKLYRNPDIHLKVIQRDDNSLHYGSANITNRGLGEKREAVNLELAGLEQTLEFEDLVYLEKILRESDRVDLIYFEQFKAQIEELKKEFKKVVPIPDFEIKVSTGDKFLLSSLPMSSSPDFLWKVYSSKDKSLFSYIDINSAASDLVNYNIVSNLGRDEFFSKLKFEVNSHPFIVSLKEAVRSKENLFMGYSELCQWLSDNTSTDPNPRRWEIKQEGKVPILHNWICRFDNDFEVDIRYPNGSDRLFYTGKETHVDLKSIISKLNRDKAHGQSAPHQIILLITLKKMIEKESNMGVFDIHKLKDEFDLAWNSYAMRLSRSTKNFAMPIHALVKNRLISVNTKRDRYRFNDRRSEKELLDNTLSISIKDYTLLNALKNSSQDEIESYI